MSGVKGMKWSRRVARKSSRRYWIKPFEIKRVMTWRYAGWSNREIAQALHMGIYRVKRCVALATGIEVNKRLERRS